MKRILNLKKALAIINSMKKARVLVAGDLIVDHFIWGSVTRISPEAPVPVVNVTNETVVLGGAANVACNIASLGGHAALSGVIGRDRDGDALKKMLKERGITGSGVFTDRHRPTTIKTRIVAQHQQVVRFDRENSEPYSPKMRSKILSSVARLVSVADVVVVSDYAKGYVSRELVERLKDACAKRGVKLAVDPKVEHMDYYWGVSVITPNNNEASAASGIKIKDGESLREAAHALLDRLSAEAVLITRGEHGMSLFFDGSETHIPTVAREVYDVSGAGDTAMAVLALSLASGATYEEAAVLSNIAAGLVVEKLGTATLTPDELKAAVRAKLAD
ncbi:MAG: D-glycero-beta-D-manno-heptose-7-phosphate kinase [Deltaproteobacteria bacterium]|nr:D-glycero-beta-D-manno-heptose-7-phosphate kinase [Deltaproteobacteria bacterium]